MYVCLFISFYLYLSSVYPSIHPFPLSCFNWTTKLESFTFRNSFFFTLQLWRWLNYSILPVVSVYREKNIFNLLLKFSKFLRRGNLPSFFFYKKCSLRMSFPQLLQNMRWISNQHQSRFTVKFDLRLNE